LCPFGRYRVALETYSDDTRHHLDGHIEHPMREWLHSVYVNVAAAVE
jgi:hypothetical protein